MGKEPETSGSWLWTETSHVAIPWQAWPIMYQILDQAIFSSSPTTQKSPTWVPTINSWAVCFQVGTLNTSWSVVARLLLSAVTRPLVLVKAIFAGPGPGPRQGDHRKYLATEMTKMVHLIKQTTSYSLSDIVSQNLYWPLSFGRPNYKVVGLYWFVATLETAMINRQYPTWTFFDSRMLMVKWFSEIWLKQSVRIFKNAWFMTYFILFRPMLYSME